MRSLSIRQAVLVAALIELAAGQESDVIPQDLQGGFNTELQVSYTGEANNGFQDGTQFSKDGMSSPTAPFYQAVLMPTRGCGEAHICSWR
jgi:hypothetical protein